MSMDEEAEVTTEQRERSGRREQNKAENRTALLKAARAVFAEMGYGAASVRDIVRRTDLASGTFYNYFKDKDEVFEAVVGELTGELLKRHREGRAKAATAEEFFRRDGDHRPGVAVAVAGVQGCGLVARDLVGRGGQRECVKRRHRAPP